MNRIDQQNSEASAQHDAQAAKRLADASKTVDIVQSHEPHRKVADYLGQLQSIQRRPPEMPLVSWAKTDSDPVNALIAPELSRLSAAQMSEFEFAVAELAWRLEEPVATSTDPALHEGHALLSQTARMFEHLHLLQTGSET